MNTEKNSFELAKEEVLALINKTHDDSSDMSQEGFNEDIADRVAKAMLDKVSAAYKEGFQTGTSSNGGLNIALKQVYTMMKHLDMPVKMTPNIGEEGEWKSQWEELEQSNLRMIGNLEDRHLPNTLKALAEAQHNLLQIVCVTGLADIFTSAFNDITRYTIELMEYNEFKEAVEKKEIAAEANPMPDEPAKPDYAAMLIERQELTARTNELLEAQRKELEKDKPKSNLIV